MSITRHPVSPEPAVLATAPPWRMRLLALDPLPEARAAYYAAWTARGATVEVETDLELALVRALRGRFTLVLVPAWTLAHLAGAGLTGGAVLDRWARAFAPAYIDRFVAYGEPDPVHTTPSWEADGADDGSAGRLPVCPAPAWPDDAAVTRTFDILERLAKAAAAHRRVKRPKNSPRNRLAG